MSDSFNDKLNKLADISTAIEKEDISLEESFALFDKGMKLAGECEKKLSQYQKKIEIIKAGNE
jgi:exodeoxyribonuclease VII small subunit